MKYKNRREEAMAKFAIEQSRKAQEAAARRNAEIAKVMSEPILHADHKRPTTRRELVSAGFMTGLGMTVTPSLLSMISQRALAVTAEECNGGGDAGGGNGGAAPVGFIQVEASGGMSIAGNVVFGKQGLGAAFEPIADYSTLGFGADIAPGVVTLNTDFGMPFHPQSQVLAGLLQTMSPEARAKTRVVAIPGTSGDDSRRNPMSLAGLIPQLRSQAALTGHVVQSDAPGGGRTAPLDIGFDPSVPRALIADANGLGALIDPGLIANRLSKDAAVKIQQAASKLSDSKLAKFNAQDLPGQVQTLVSCGYLGAESLLTDFSVESLSPDNDPDITGTPFGNLNAANITEESQQRAVLVSTLVNKGNAASATIEIGGMDYHGQGRDRQNTKDLNIGMTLGISAEIAHRKGQALVQVLTSDGSTAASQGGAGHVAHRSDSGTRGAVLVMITGATEAPEIANNQIGKFNDTGAVDTGSSIMAASPQLQALWAAWTYAVYSGPKEVEQFNKIVSAAGISNPFKEQEHLGFAPRKA